MTEELKDKLLKWVGFSFTDVDPGDGGCLITVLVFPDGHRGLYSEEPKLTSSLDACFKWLVPKLYKRKLWFEFLGDGIVGYDFRIMEIAGNKPVSIYQGKAPALALCKAIEQLIDKEQK